MLVKFCRGCDSEAEFTRSAASQCRECAKAKVRAWREANPEKYKALYTRNNAQKEKRRASLLESRYGITVDEYERMYAEQGGVCRITGCLTAGAVLDVDHDHKTGRVRGLLCRNCNLAIGLLADDSARVHALAVYLEDA